MTGPVVLLMVAAMALVVLFCAGRLVLAPRRPQPSDRGTDLLHGTMGTAMGAMLLGLLGRSWDVLWVAGFGLAGLWFLRSGVVSLGRLGWRSVLTQSRSRHSLQHGAGCLAMVAMLVAGSSSYAVGAVGMRGPRGRGIGGMNGMGVGASSSSAGAVLLLALAGAVLALGAVDVVQIGRGGSAALGEGQPVLAPRCAAACRVVMSLTMGLALLTLL
jgi:hypothetical protein